MKISNLFIDEIVKPDINVHMPMQGIYDYIFAIDTNTKEIKDLAIHCSAIIQVVSRQIDGDWVSIHDFIGAFVFINSKVSAEKVGWYYTINYVIARNEGIPSGKKVLLLTDHDLGMHKEINNRNIDIVPNLKIPNGFYLGYATSDRQDDLSNNLIGLCDIASTEILKSLDDRTLTELYSFGAKGSLCDKLVMVRNQNADRVDGLFYF